MLQLNHYLEDIVKTELKFFVIFVIYMCMTLLMFFIYFYQEC